MVKRWTPEEARASVLRWLQSYAVREGEEFKLSSGGTSTTYIDVKRAALHERCLLPLATMLYDVLAQGTFGMVEAVAGVALGGCHLASITALYGALEGVAPLHVVYVRSQKKTMGHRISSRSRLPRKMPTWCSWKTSRRRENLPPEPSMTS